MALSAAEQASIAAIAQREGGWDVLIPEIADAIAAERKQAALTALNGCVTVTVTDWPKVRAVFAAASQYRLSLGSILDDIMAAGTAGDASKLGAQLILAAAAIKGRIG